MRTSQIVVALRIAGYGLLGLASDVDRGVLDGADVWRAVVRIVRQLRGRAR